MYITEDEFARLDCKTLNIVLERLQAKTSEAVLLMLPEVIIGLNTKTKGIQNMMADFMKKHPEFAGKEADIVLVVEALEAEDGSRNLSQILDLVPERMKKLNLSVETPIANDRSTIERTSNGFL